MKSQHFILFFCRGPERLRYFPRITQLKEPEFHSGTSMLWATQPGGRGGGWSPGSYFRLQVLENEPIKVVHPSSSRGRYVSNTRLLRGCGIWNHCLHSVCADLSHPLWGPVKAARSFLIGPAPPSRRAAAASPTNGPLR